MTSELSCSLSEGSRAGRRLSVSSLGFYALLLLLSANWFGRRSCGGLQTMAAHIFQLSNT